MQPDDEERERLAEAGLARRPAVARLAEQDAVPVTGIGGPGRPQGRTGPVGRDERSGSHGAQHRQARWQSRGPPTNVAAVTSHCGPGVPRAVLHRRARHTEPVGGHLLPPVDSDSRDRGLTSPVAPTASNLIHYPRSRRSVGTCGPDSSRPTNRSHPVSPLSGAWISWEDGTSGRGLGVDLVTRTRLNRARPDTPTLFGADRRDRMPAARRFLPRPRQARTGGTQR